VTLVGACSSSDTAAEKPSSTLFIAAATSDPTTSATDTTSSPASSSRGVPITASSTVVATTEPTSDADDGENPEPADAPDQRPLPRSAEELADALNESELALRAPDIDQATAAPWGRRQQALYRVLAFNLDWEDTTMAAIDPDVADAVANNWQARKALVALVNTEELTHTLPAWRIGPPPPADELLGYYLEAEEASGVPWEVVAAINLVETRMGRIKGVSTAGAVGPMQFLPTTWAECCSGDATDPRDAIIGAGSYLRQRGATKNLNRAIFGYNNSDYYVTAVTSYAAVLEADPDAYYGYHAWQVYYLSAEGLVVIPEGYEQLEPIDAATWLTHNPDARFDS